MPAVFHFEKGGSITNTQKYIQQFEKAQQAKTSLDNLEQISGLFKAFGVEQSADSNVVFDEISNILSEVLEYKPELINMEVDSHAVYFNHDCDVIIKKINSIFEF